MRPILAIMCLAMLLAACGAWAQTADVPRDHWAYEAVSELADRGLVLGYPDGNFLGERTLTRYEMAALVKRVLDRIEQMQPAPTVAATPAPAPATPPAPGVSPEDLAAINRLVEEYKVELAVMGTRIDRVEQRLDELETKVGAIDSIVTDEEGALESTRADVSKLKKVTVSGYVQARYQSIDFSKEDTAEDAQTDTFMVRRARIKATGNPTARSRAVVQLEAAKNSTSVKDAYIQYILAKNQLLGPTLTFGQFNWPFGYIVPLSSSARLAPERPIVFRRLFPGERDQGAKIESAIDRPWYWQLGVFNGTGTEKNSASDLNSAKDIVANVHRSFGDNLEAGLSYYDGRGVWTTFGVPGTYQNGVDKVRYGADAQYFGNNYTLKAEYVRGKGVDIAAGGWNQGDWIEGYYGQVSFNVSRSDMLVARYSAVSDDPVRPTFGRRTAWDLGAIRTLDPRSMLKLFYVLNNEETNEIDNDGFTLEWLVRY